VLLPIEDENAAEIAFRAGELDYTKVAASSAQGLTASPPEGSQF
jgi:ABC-type oligopeptide transport system substrate-binding subunit